MISTLVGYSGGTTVDPTYRNIGDHAETVRIEYDPSVITYEELLAAFWDSHTPLFPPGRRQYMSAIFVHDNHQEQAARASKAAREQKMGMPFHTEITAAGPFYRAEGYHQKHTLRGYGALMAELRERFSTEEEIHESTVAARLNGYLAGYGDCDEVKKQLPDLNLSPEAQQQLLTSACGSGAAATCPLPAASTAD